MGHTQSQIWKNGYLDLSIDVIEPYFPKTNVTKPAEKLHTKIIWSSSIYALSKINHRNFRNPFLFHKNKLPMNNLFFSNYCHKPSCSPSRENQTMCSICFTTGCVTSVHIITMYFGIRRYTFITNAAVTTKLNSYKNETNSVCKTITYQKFSKLTMQSGGPPWLSGCAWISSSISPYLQSYRTYQIFTMPILTFL